jgi:hypothetical protein
MEARVVGAKALERKPPDGQEIYNPLQVAVKLLKPAALVLPPSIGAMNVFVQSI